MSVATHSEIAGAAVLNAICRHGARRRHVLTHPPAAIASTAGPGPNHSAVVMKNVSAIEMLAAPAANTSRNDPATIASAASVSQPSGCGVRAAAKAALTTTATPRT